VLLSSFADELLVECPPICSFEALARMDACSGTGRSLTRRFYSRLSFAKTSLAVADAFRADAVTNTILLEATWTAHARSLRADA
jgi:hypothetical protein